MEPTTFEQQQTRQTVAVTDRSGARFWIAGIGAV
jgi:hypothetical protein